MLIGVSSLFLSRYSLAPVAAPLAASRTSGLNDIADWAELENRLSLISDDGGDIVCLGRPSYGVSKSLLSSFLLGEEDPPNGLKLFSLSSSSSFGV